MSLRTRLSIALGTLMVVLALGGSVGVMVVRQGDSARDRHDRALEQLALGNQLLAAYQSQSAAFRVFLLTGEDTHAAREEEARADAARLDGQLRATGLTVAETAALDQAVNGADRWQREAVDPLIALRRESDADVVAVQYAEVDSFDLFVGIEKSQEAFQGLISEQAADSARVATRGRQDLARLAFALLVAAMVLVVVVKVAGRRWISGPILALSRAVEDLSPTDVDSVIAGTGPPEVVALGAEIERMRRRVADVTQRSHEGLVQHASVLMSVRARLESAPELMPSGWSVSASLTPATGVVAGDCYDVAWVQPSRLGLVVVDVAGHGAESAVVALRAKELLRAASRTYLDLGEGLQWVNRQLDGLAPDMFITAFVAILDTGAGSLHYLSAGHPPALLCGVREVTELPSTGPIIGPFEASWGSGRVTISPGQALLVYTDGLTELRDDDRNEYGLERLRTLASEGFDDAEALVKRCLDETASFSTIRGHDDVTLVAICRADV